MTGRVTALCASTSSALSARCTGFRAAIELVERAELQRQLRFRNARMAVIVSAALAADFSSACQSIGEMGCQLRSSALARRIRASKTNVGGSTPLDPSAMWRAFPAHRTILRHRRRYFEFHRVLADIQFCWRADTAQGRPAPCAGIRCRPGGSPSRLARTIRRSTRLSVS